MSTWSCFFVKTASLSWPCFDDTSRCRRNRNECVVGRSPEAAVREPHRQRCPFLSGAAVGFATRAAVLPAELLSPRDGIQAAAGQQLLDEPGLQHQVDSRVEVRLVGGARSPDPMRFPGEVQPPDAERFLVEGRFQAELRFALDEARFPDEAYSPLQKRPVDVLVIDHIEQKPLDN